MSEISLKYGLNPNQTTARVICDDPSPLEVINGRPSYINMLDGLRGWQLARELQQSLQKPAAASMKHVSPAGAAVAGELSAELREAHLYGDQTLSPVASAYAKARSSDRQASFGDFIAVSEPVDASLAQLIKPEVSDGIIAPGYDEQALQILKQKKGGGYVIFQMDPNYTPPETESRVEFGIRLEQSINDAPINRKLLSNVVTRQTAIPDDVAETLLVTTITLKHTQSNSVAVGYQGQAIGIGAGQQSRIACTRLACDKAERWLLKMHPRARQLPFTDDLKRPDKVNLIDSFVMWDQLDQRERHAMRDQLSDNIHPLTAEEKHDWLDQFPGLVLSSDAFLPFRDNVDRAARTGIQYVMQAGGSKRDQDVTAAADEHNMVMVNTGLRLFLH
jgi:AICAR transformylase/IMP cyclohydrolase PurH